MLWCIEQLELSLQSGKLNEKRSTEVNKSIKTLKNPKTPLIKMRQLMRSQFGDYRSKMASEEKSAGKLDMNKVKLAEVAKEKCEKSKFVKKSASLTTDAKNDANKSDTNNSTPSSFRFSFNID